MFPSILLIDVLILILIYTPQFIVFVMETKNDVTLS